MIAELFFSVLVVLFFFGEASMMPRKMPGIDFMGRGYDLVLANPQYSNGEGDPGWLGEDNVFAIVASLGIQIYV